MSTKADLGTIETVIVAIDASEESLRALPPARLLADATNAELVAVSVVAKPGDRTRVAAELESRLDQYATPVDRTLVPVNGYTIGQGLESAAYGQESLVVVATRGHSRNRFMTGSVAEELVHARPERPTILVGPNVESAVDLRGPMVLCVDPERPSPAGQRLAGRFARQLSMESLAVSVVPPAGRGAGGATLTTAPVTVLEGSRPAEAIVDYAAAVGASLITVETRPRVGLSRLAFGSVAMDTVSRARCPVLAVPQAQ